jgi:hypothetical protein
MQSRSQGLSSERAHRMRNEKGQPGPVGGHHTVGQKKDSERRKECKCWWIARTIYISKGSRYIQKFYMERREWKTTPHRNMASRTDVVDFNLFCLNYIITKAEPLSLATYLPRSGKYMNRRGLTRQPWKWFVTLWQTWPRFLVKRLAGRLVGKVYSKIYVFQIMWA